MRLTHLKLAGFKSFVDPTTIHLHGQRVGVVGPNGCGKSNVMESVRWVLGESSAKEMRADAMDAVIFNGSAQRKAISRASVELIFDNSMGGAGGEWNQYAEISVKRVIEREKGSTYYINNTAVRRRDVADLFLGTGLGGRAYAIIGQNTISRIVEAKPEELRVFLEEAAGISKYKERRRETELRLRDTRDNLSRVEDISREMNKHILKLEAQADTTQRFLNYEQSLKIAEAQWWWLRKRDAVLAHEAAHQQVSLAINALEAQTAIVSQLALQLELTRQSQQASASQLHAAQAQYYECHAQVSNLSLQVQQSEEARARLIQQQQQIAAQLEKNTQLEATLTAKQVENQQACVAAEQLVTTALTEVERLQHQLPAQSAAWQSSQALLQQAEHAVQQQQQRSQLERNQMQFTERQLNEASQRVLQLKQSLEQWALPDMADLADQQAQWSQLQQALVAAEQALLVAREEEQHLQATLQTERGQLQEAQRGVHQAEAELQSLQKLQRQVSSDQNLQQWLQQTGLTQAKRLWQSIEIDAKWQSALEAYLGLKLNAFIAAQSLPSIATHPDAAVSVICPSPIPTELSTPWRGLPSLCSQVICQPPELAHALQHWLAGVYLIEEMSQLQSHQSALMPGQSLLTPKGDVYHRDSVTYHGQQHALQGVLERQQQIAHLALHVPNQQALVVAAQQRVHALESSLQTIRATQQQCHQEIKQLGQQAHGLQLAIAHIQQAHDNALKRQASLMQEQAQAVQKVTQFEADLVQVSLTVSALDDTLPALRLAAQTASTQKIQAEQAYFQTRDTLQAAEKNHQAQTFQRNMLQHGLHELQQKITQTQDEATQLHHRLAEVTQTLTVSAMETLKAHLVSALDAQQQAEQALAAAREHVSEQDSALQQQERLRMQAEQQLHPLRDTLEQRRLAAQACLLQVDQCRDALEATGLDEALLKQGLTTETTADSLAKKTQQLQQQIQQLGPVNMAAIAELASETERKGYLDSQLKDLLTASETLETAIQKIDRETRGKLKATFEEANRHFGELFQTLFNGGNARLELLGDEILDTGVQVFAQPPGKKNTTIQLLSGGEKALTAMALVFALFRLNPAPFCLMDEVDAPLDDSNTERFTQLVKVMSEKTQFLFVSHNKITMEMSQQLIGVTMQESGVSRIVDVDIDEAIRMHAA